MNKFAAHIWLNTEALHLQACLLFFPSLLYVLVSSTGSP